VDDRELWQRIHEQVVEIRRMNVESRDFMPAVVATLVRIGSVLKDLGAEIRDLTAESRAQRQALLRVLDRMDRLDPGGSAA